jgi:hypothetical protein
MPTASSLARAVNTSSFSWIVKWIPTMSTGSVLPGCIIYSCVTYSSVAEVKGHMCRMQPLHPAHFSPIFGCLATGLSSPVASTMRQYPGRTLGWGSKPASIRRMALTKPEKTSLPNVCSPIDKRVSRCSAMRRRYAWRNSREDSAARANSCSDSLLWMTPLTSAQRLSHGEEEASAGPAKRRRESLSILLMSHL